VRQLSLDSQASCDDLPAPAPPQIDSWHHFVDSQPAGTDAFEACLEVGIARAFPLRLRKGLTVELVNVRVAKSVESSEHEDGKSYCWSVWVSINIHADQPTGVPINVAREIRLLDLPAITDRGSFVIEGRELVFVTERRINSGLIVLPRLGRNGEHEVHEERHAPTVDEASCSLRIVPAYGEVVSLRRRSNGRTEIGFGPNAWIGIPFLFRAMGTVSERDFLHLFCVEARLPTAAGRVLHPSDRLARPIRLGDSQDGMILHNEGAVLSPTERDQLFALGIEEYWVYRWRRRVTMAEIEADGATGALAADATDPLSGDVVCHAGEVLDSQSISRLKSIGLTHIELADESYGPLVEEMLAEWRGVPPVSRRKALEKVATAIGVDARTDGAMRAAIDHRFASPRFRFSPSGRLRFERAVSRPHVRGERSLSREDLIAAIARLSEIAVLDVAHTEAEHLTNFGFHSAGTMVSSELERALSAALHEVKWALRMASDQEPEDTWDELFASVCSRYLRRGIASRCSPVNCSSPSAREGQLRLVRSADTELRRDRRVARLFRSPHLSWYSRLCLVDGPGDRMEGLTQHLAKYARIRSDSSLEAPFCRVDDGKMSSRISWLAPGEDEGHWFVSYEARRGIRPEASGARVTDVRSLGRRDGELGDCSLGTAEFVDAFPDQVLSARVADIPFVMNSAWHNARRGVVASAAAQSLRNNEAPLIQNRSNKLGRERQDGANLVSAYLSWYGATWKDSVIVSDSVIRAGKLTSINTHEFWISAAPLLRGRQLSRGVSALQGGTCDHVSRRNLDPSGTVRVGAMIRPGAVLLSLVEAEPQSLTPHQALASEVLGIEWSGADRSIVAPHSLQGVVHELEWEVNSSEKGEWLFTLIQAATMRETARMQGQLLREVRQILVGNTVLRGLVGSNYVKLGKLTVEQVARIANRSIQLDKLELEDSRSNTLIEELKKRACDLAVDESETLRHWKECIRIKGSLGTEWARLRIQVQEQQALEVGDAIYTRHGGGGTVAAIVPAADMPILPDGSAVELILSPLAVLGDQRIGELLEAIAGCVASELDVEIVAGVLPAHAWPQLLFLYRVASLHRVARSHSLLPGNIGIVSVAELQECISMIARLGSPLMADLANDTSNLVVTRACNAMRTLVEGIEAQEVSPGDEAVVSEPATLDARLGAILARAGFADDGRAWLRDGRTGERLSAPVTFGVLWAMRVGATKILPEARSTGTYSLFSKQPLHSTSPLGAQSVSSGAQLALAAHGAAFSLLEMQTIKSDDVDGRNKVFEAIVRGRTAKHLPSSLATEALFLELKGLGLAVHFGRDSTT
jgi:DNA-directed RNA polymerase beta subunit